MYSKYPFAFLSWVEFWQRKRRQYICSSQTWTDTVFRTFMNSPCQVYGRHNCDDHDDDLRETRCDNKGGQQLLEVSNVHNPKVIDRLID